MNLDKFFNHVSSLKLSIHDENFSNFLKIFLDFF